mgnify:CR=1 FL=1
MDVEWLWGEGCLLREGVVVVVGGVMMMRTVTMMLRCGRWPTPTGPRSPCGAAPTSTRRWAWRRSRWTTGGPRRTTCGTWRASRAARATAPAAGGRGARLLGRRTAWRAPIAPRTPPPPPQLQAAAVSQGAAQTLLFKETEEQERKAARGLRSPGSDRPGDR